MDQPVNCIRTPIPTPSTVLRHPQRKIIYQAPYNLKSPPSAQIRSLDSTSTFSAAHFTAKPLPDLSSPTNRTPKLNALISKFEALDALSLSARKAQPAQFHLPRDRITDTPEMGRIKVTRENLLRSFERPGWGAETLRGLSRTRDLSAYRGVDEMDSVTATGFYGSKIYENASTPASGAQSLGGRGILGMGWKTKEGGDKMWSRVKDRIRFFDGGMVASHATSQQASITSPAIIRPHTESPRKQSGIVRAPTRFGGTEHQRAFPVRLNHDIDPAYSRGRALHREKYPSPPRTPIRAWAGARQRNEAFEVARTKLNDRASEAYFTSPCGLEQAANMNLLMDDRAPLMTNNPFLTPRTVFEERRMDEGTVDEYQGHLKNKESVLRIGEPQSIDTMRRTRRESKLQARIMLFNQNGPNLRYRLPPPASPSKYHPTTVSQERYRTQAQTLTTTHPSSPKEACRSQKSLCHAHPTSPNQPPIAISPAAPVEQLPETHINVPPPPPPPEPHTPAPRKQSQIDDRIRHFESIVSGQPHQSILEGTLAKPNMSEPPRPKAKRVETWPLATPARASKPKLPPAVHTRRKEYSSQSNPITAMTPHRMGYQMDLKGNRDRLRDRSREKNMQRIQARQERMNRRSRSRSRSGVNMAGYLHHREKHRQRQQQQQQQQEGGDSAPAPVLNDAQARSHSQAKREARARAKVELILDAATYELSKRQRQRDASRNRNPSHDNVDVNIVDHVHGDNNDDAAPVAEIWVDGSEETSRAGGSERNRERVLNSVIAQCELEQPQPLRLAETFRIVRLCGKGFGERAGRGLGLGVRM